MNENSIIRQLRMRAKNFHNLPPARRPKTDPSKTSGKNPLNGLIKPLQELAKSVTETSSKVRKPKTYNEAVNNQINENK